MLTKRTNHQPDFFFIQFKVSGTTLTFWNLAPLITGRLKSVFKTSFVRYRCLKDVSETAWPVFSWEKFIMESSPRRASSILLVINKIPLPSLGKKTNETVIGNLFCNFVEGLVYIKKLRLLILFLVYFCFIITIKKK